MKRRSYSSCNGAMTKSVMKRMGSCEDVDSSERDEDEDGL
jgi:hypothetical protein